MTDPFAPTPSSTRTDRSLTKLPPHASRVTTWDPAVPADGAHAAYHYVHAQRRLGLGLGSGLGVGVGLGLAPYRILPYPTLPDQG